MKIIKQNIFDGNWDILVHVCNIYHTWGAGIVVPIKKLYPEAYYEDLATKYGDEQKLGYFSYACIGDKKIVNLYAQVGIGNNGDPLNRNLRYDALFDALYRLCVIIGGKPTVIGVPDMIGCGLAGGSRKIVLAILEDLEDNWDNIEFNIFQKP